MRPDDEQDWLQRLDRRLLNWFWQGTPPSGWRGCLFGAARVLHLALRSSYIDRIPFSANALTFITLLGMVPALAISFSLAKGLGFANPLREFLLHNEFLSSQQEVLARIIGYVERTSVGTLGMVGLAVLVVTIVLALSNVEEVFNRIWEVRASRTLLRRFTDYVAVLVICPILVLAAAGSWAAFTSHSLVRWLLQMEVIGQVAQTGMGLMPFALLVAAFVLMYLFLPNTRIPFLSALLAGAVAAGLWWLVQSLYIAFQVGVTRYNAIYGGFASLPLFMIWLHMSWMVVLFGAELAHAHHVCRHGPLPPAVSPELGPAGRELLGLRLFFLLARSFYRGEGPCPLTEVVRELKSPWREVQVVLKRLMASGLVSEAGSSDYLQPGRSLASITPAQVWRALRGGEPPAPPGEAPRLEHLLADLLRQAECAAHQVLSRTPVLELLQAESPAPETSGQDPCRRD